MTKYKIGDKVRCISDDAGNIQPGTILTIKGIDIDGDLLFKDNPGILLYKHEVEPLTRTIRDVKEGDQVFDNCDDYYEVLAVGKKGFILEDEVWWTFDEAEDEVLTIKDQPTELPDFVQDFFNEAEVVINKLKETK